MNDTRATGRNSFGVRNENQLSNAFDLREAGNFGSTSTIIVSGLGEHLFWKFLPSPKQKTTKKKSEILKTDIRNS